MRAGDCVHFNGIQHDRCAAGVDYMAVRDASGPGMARFPCLPSAHRGKACATSCVSFRAATAEDEAADKAEVMALLGLVGSDLSPCCKAALTGPAEGPGVRHCSACKRFVMRSCNPREGM